MQADAPLYVRPIGGRYAAVKPTLDVFAAACLLLLTFPFMMFAWAVMRVTSAGPGFYFQTRCGKNGRRYQIAKIRSMYHHPSVAKNTDWAKLKGDARVTPVGRLLRATHLDELPQLFNVLWGEMSLIGPRPERPEVIEKKRLARLVPGYDLRLAIKPGVTGLAQVQLPADSDVVSVRHKVCYDLYYLANQTAWLDVRICLATALKSFLPPESLRKWLALPTREQVCEQFLVFLTPPADEFAVRPAPAA